MEDQFVWRYGDAYTLLTGSRKKGKDRRSCRERRGCIARGIFAVHVVDRRRNTDRRQVSDRREENGVYSTVAPFDKTRAATLGFLLSGAGIVAVILGALVSETVSISLGLFISMGSIFLVIVHVLYPKKPSVNLPRH